MKCHTLKHTYKDFSEKLLHRKCWLLLFWNASQNKAFTSFSAIASSSCKEQQSQYFLNYWLTIYGNDCLKYSINAFYTNYIYVSLDPCISMKHLHSSKVCSWRQQHWSLGTGLSSGKSIVLTGSLCTDRSEDCCRAHLSSKPTNCSVRL